jgi:hypothetical protein
LFWAGMIRGLPFLGKEEVTGSNPVVGFQINLSGN